jgi:hypothetical protein
MAIKRRVRHPTKNRAVPLSEREEKSNGKQLVAPATPVYYDTPVRCSALVAVLYGIVGMLVGVIIAAQLAWPELNLGIPFLSYGRLRPLHTNAVIFAFGGCVLFATSLPRGAANLPDAAVPAQAGDGHLLGLEPGHRAGRHHACRWASRPARSTPSSSGRSTS